MSVLRTVPVEKPFALGMKLQIKFTPNVFLFSRCLEKLTLIRYKDLFLFTAYHFLGLFQLKRIKVIKWRDT